jgi:hypothetical protein
VRQIGEWELEEREGRYLRSSLGTVRPTGAIVLVGPVGYVTVELQSY